MHRTVLYCHSAVTAPCVDTRSGLNSRCAALGSGCGSGSGWSLLSSVRSSRSTNSGYALRTSRSANEYRRPMRRMKASSLVCRKRDVLPPVSGAQKAKAVVRMRRPCEVSFCALHRIVSSRGLLAAPEQRRAPSMADELVAHHHVERRLLGPVAFEVPVFRLWVQPLCP